MLLKNFAKKIKRIYLNKKFQSSSDYWEKRYKSHGNSGDGSYNELANFKAEILNKFSQDNKIHSIIEYGCGDGNQLTLAKYEQYIGFDVSKEAISICKNKFSKDTRKSFYLISEWSEQIKADLCLSLDVIYHLVEDHVYEDYMNKLFTSSTRFVIIYSSNIEETAQNRHLPHVRQRKFTDWVNKNASDWHLVNTIKNRYPYSPETNTGSISDFFIFSQVNRDI